MADDQSRIGQAYQAAQTARRVKRTAEAARAGAMLMNPFTLGAIGIGVAVFVGAIVLGLVITAMAGSSPGGGKQQAPAAGSSASCGQLSGTPKEIIDNVALPIAHEIAFEDVTPESVDAANAAHSDLTTSGNPSDHKGPPEVAWAADISNGLSPTPEMDKLAEALARCFGITWNGSGLVNGSKDGYRFQLIYRTDEGGDHFDHVHIGVAKE